MLDEKLKSYNICEQCCNNKDCKHYAETHKIIEYFKETPLNLHFPMCSEYQSTYNKIMRDIEALPIPEHIKTENDELFRKEAYKMLLNSCIPNIIEISEEDGKDMI